MVASFTMSYKSLAAAVLLVFISFDSLELPYGPEQQAIELIKQYIGQCQ
jgi:hypothetical protein